MTRTAVVWLDGERFVFRDDEVDKILAIGKKAKKLEDAWDELERYGRNIDA